MSYRWRLKKIKLEVKSLFLIYNVLKTKEPTTTALDQLVRQELREPPTLCGPNESAWWSQQLHVCQKPEAGSVRLPTPHQHAPLPAARASFNLKL